MCKQGCGEGLKQLTFCSWIKTAEVPSDKTEDTSRRNDDNNANDYRIQTTVMIIIIIIIIIITLKY